MKTSLSLSVTALLAIVLAVVFDIVNNANSFYATEAVIGFILIRVIVCCWITYRAFNVLLSLDIRANSNGNQTTMIHLNVWEEKRIGIYKMAFEITKWTVNGFYGDLIKSEQTS